MSMPPARHAVLVHERNVATIQEGWRAFADWLPSSGLRPGNPPDFELYDERCDGATADGGVELKVSVQ
jgi:predicted transcriptional regulator YdeE